MKKLLHGIKTKITKISVKNAIQCLSVTAGVCAFALVGALVFANHEKLTENGQGGLETPHAPISDAVFDELAQSQEGANPSLEDEYNLSYISYRIRRGDMVSRIAEKFGVSEDTIITANNIRATRTIQIGVHLKIPSMPGILYTVRNDGETINQISEKYEIDAVKCSAVNHLSQDESLSSGFSLFLPDAKLDWVTRQEINGDLFRKPIRARWYRSSRFGWRASPFTGARSYHSGVDMACPTGTKIYAALPGRVTSTGYNSTYGNYVIIAHHSGYKTLYGHLSAITCVKGAKVDQNSNIGRVGSTGMSTGPHLHFTVFKNNKAVNPENLWN